MIEVSIFAAFVAVVAAVVRRLGRKPEPQLVPVRVRNGQAARVYRYRD